MRTKNSNREVFRKWRKLCSWGSGRMLSLMKKMVTKTRQEWKIETTIIIIIIAARVVKILLTSVNITWQSFLSWYFFSRCSSHFYDGSQGIKTYTNDNSNRTILWETWIESQRMKKKGMKYNKSCSLRQDQRDRLLLLQQNQWIWRMTLNDGRVMHSLLELNEKDWLNEKPVFCMKR